MSTAWATFAFCNGMTRAQREFTMGRFYPESPSIALENVDRTGMPDSVPRTWILTTRDRTLSVKSQRRSIAAIGGVQTVIPIDTCHDLMISEPNRLAEILVDRCRLYSQRSVPPCADTDPRRVTPPLKCASLPARQSCRQVLRYRAFPIPRGPCPRAVEGLAWYSIIHVPDAHLAQVFDEFYRVLIPGGLVLLAFQVGDEPRVLTNVFDQQVALTFIRRRPRQVEKYLVDSGFHIYAELVREPDDDGFASTSQAYLIAHKEE